MDNLTEELKDLLKPNILNKSKENPAKQDEEENTMADMKSKLRSARNAKIEKEEKKDIPETVETSAAEESVVADAEKTTGVSEAPTATEVVPETSGTDETEDGSIDELKRLVEASQNAITDEEPVASGEIEKTKIFSGDGAETKINIEPNATEKGSGKKSKSLYERNEEAARHNSEINAWISSLESKVQDVENLTDEQKMFQLACGLHFRNKGFIVMQDAFPEMKISRKFKKDSSSNWVPRAGVSKDDINRWNSSDVKSREKRGNMIESVASLTATYVTPKKILGGIVEMPLCANIPVVNFQNNNFSVDADLFKTSEKINLVVDLDLLFVYTVLYCGGEMKEASYMNSSTVRFERQAGEQSIIGTYSRRERTVDGVKEKTTAKVLKPTNRKSLLVRENIIPITRFQTTSVSKMSADVIKGYKTKFKKALGTPKDENRSIYDILNAKHQGAFKVAIGGDGKSIEDVELNFPNSNLLGTGDFSDIVLRDWSDVTRDSKNKVSKAVIRDMRVVSLTHTYSSKDNTESVNPSKTKLNLGIDFNLKTLASEGYLAAQMAEKSGLTEQDILKLYNDYKNAEEEKRYNESVNRDVLGKKAVARRKNSLDNDHSTKLLLAALSNKELSEADIDNSTVAETLRMVNMTYGTQMDKAESVAE